MATFPAKVDYADGNVLTAAQMNDVGAQLNALTYTAGKNKILNGDFGIWQRGTSIACSTGAVFTADRFSTNRDGSGATVTVSRQAFTPGDAPVAGYEGAYFIRFNQSVAGSGASFSVLQTAIEDVRTLAGQTVTFSFWAKASANYNANVTARQYFGVGGSASVDTYFGTFNVTTSWTRFTTSVTLPSVSGKTIGTGSALVLWIDLPMNAIRTVDTWGWQLEAGSVATPFTTATGNPASELAACQRYYERVTVPAGGITQFGGPGYSTTNAAPYGGFTVTKRVAPTSIDYSNLQLYDLSTAYAVTSVTLWGSTSAEAGGILAQTAGTLTQYRHYILSGNAGGGYIGFSAEL